MASLRNKKLVIAPNVQYEFPIRGNTVKVVDASCVVYFKTQDGQIDFYLEKGERASFENIDFLNLVIYHLEDTDQKISISVGDGAEITSARVAGEVSVIDGSLIRVSKGKSFIGGGAISGLAGNYTNIQLFNPVESGVILNLDTVILAAEVNTAIAIRGSNLPLSTFMQLCGNKKIGDIQSKAKINIEHTLSVPVSLNYTGVQLTAFKSENIELKDAIRIEPGYGLLLTSRDINVTMRASFQFFEENI